MGEPNTADVATIFALATAPGRAGVAIVRVSGPRAGRVLADMARVVATPRMALRARLIDPADGEPLDEALVIWFPAPHSFTGDDVVELHLHGGRAVVAGVLATLARFSGLRLAEPGEFTRRAFEHGKIDLTEAEGLADLIEAETELQRRAALRQLAGDLHRTAEEWRAQILQARALVEAAIDFSDESDVSGRAVDDAGVIVADVARRLAAMLDDGRRGEIIRDGLQVVISGPPNVGKSSLINALARRDAAIVDAVAGTTRDVVELQLNLAGMAIVLADTAGLRAADGAVEREGIRRGLARAQAAQVVLWVVDATSPQLALPADFDSPAATTIWVVNKIDCVAPTAIASLTRDLPDDRWVAVSARDGAGITELEALLAALGRSRTAAGEAALITSVRHRQQITAAAVALADFEHGDKAELELRAEDLRRSSDALGRLVGRVDPEEVLGEIFGRFCIGK